MTDELYIAGTRTFAAEVADLAADAGFAVRGLLEPYDRTRTGPIHELPVTWLEDAAPGLVVVGTGERDRRAIVERLTAAGFEFATLVHPRAHVSRTTSIGPGSVVSAGVVVGARTAIGSQVVLGRGALIGHHTEIGDFSTINPGANVAGNVVVGEDAFIGLGAVVRDHLAVGAAALVAAGAVVVGEVEPGAQVRGLPARVHDPDRDRVL